MIVTVLTSKIEKVVQPPRRKMKITVRFFYFGGCYIVMVMIDMIDYVQCARCNHTNTI